MKLRNRRSYLPTSPESRPPKARAPKVTHYVYLLLLVGILGYLAYIVWQRVMFVEAKGQVEVERITVSSSRGGKISQLPVSDGQAVRNGDLLARILPPQECRAEKDTPRLNDVRMEASLTASEIAILSDRLAELRAQLFERQRLRRALEIDTKLADIAREIRDSIESTKEDIARKRARLGLLQERIEQLQTRVAEQIPPPECRPEVITAPGDGHVYRVAHKKAEIVARAEPLLTFIPGSPKVWVEALIPNDSVDQLSAGQKVSILFPDGVRSSGIVTSITSTTSNVIRPDWEPEPPPANHARLIIRPAKPSDSTRWQTYNRMTVTMRAKQ